eukprot:6157620-Pleurochrysis_carterae.AAC.1
MCETHGHCRAAGRVRGTISLEVHHGESRAGRKESRKLRSEPEKESERERASERASESDTTRERETGREGEREGEREIGVRGSSQGAPYPSLPGAHPPLADGRDGGARAVAQSVRERTIGIREALCLLHTPQTRAGRCSAQPLSRECSNVNVGCAE